MAAELATQPAAWDRQQDGVSRVSAAMVVGLETLLRDAEAHIAMPTEFVVPGETLVSAALELARTILRRAERRAVTLGAEGLIPGPHLLPYLNRLADLVWVLARAAEQAEARSAPPSRPDRRRPARTEERSMTMNNPFGTAPTRPARCRRSSASARTPSLRPAS